MFTMVLVSVLTVFLLSLLVSVWHSQGLLFARMSHSANFADFYRVARQDLHAAVKVSRNVNGLDVTEADGIEYLYFLNAHQQVIRSRLGGGTSVLATQTVGIHFTVDSHRVAFRITFENGQTFSGIIAILS